MGLFQSIADPSQPPPFVAELSGNHNQNFDTAKELIRLAAENGAYAIKLQTYTADSLTLPSNAPDFVVQDGLWKGQSLYELYQKAATPYAWHAPLAETARQYGLPLFSTPFDEEAVDFLEHEIEPELYKVSSFEVTHTPLLKKIGSLGKPVILSIGMATEEEISRAVQTLDASGSGPVALLECVSEYPSSPDTFNLRTLPALAKRFDCLTGLSDHTLSSEVALAATALGARIIEKHFTDDRESGGIDAAFSIEPQELRSLVDQLKIVHSALGSEAIGRQSGDDGQRRFRRSIYASKNIRQGESLTPGNLKIVRPSTGLDPRFWDEVIGKAAARDIEAFSPLLEGDWV